MRICFLIGDYVPHQVLSIKTLVEKNHAEVIAFHVGRYITETPQNIKNFSTIQYGTLSKNKMFQKIILFSPHIIITAGWMISEYNWICKKIRTSSSIPVVAMSDTPWYGTWKQIVNTLISPFHLKKAFTHIWVAGIRQYDYARKLGFSNQQIIFNALCADLDIFELVDIENKVKQYPKNFLFIGRYTEVKGLKTLMNAWNQIKNKRGWSFTLIGNGDMKNELKNHNGFNVKNYMSQTDLLLEFEKSGCFVLPSFHEPWGLVIHEAAASGLPIICTESCGAAQHFVISGYNGYQVKNNSVDDLKEKLEEIINTPEERLLVFGRRSRQLSKSITPELQSASLMQLLHDNK